MAVDYGHHGVRANTICPCSIPTPLVMNIRRQQAVLDHGKDPDKVVRQGDARSAKVIHWAVWSDPIDIAHTGLPHFG